MPRKRALHFHPKQTSRHCARKSAFGILDTSYDFYAALIIGLTIKRWINVTRSAQEQLRAQSSFELLDRVGDS